MGRIQGHPHTNGYVTLTQAQPRYRMRGALLEARRAVERLRIVDPDPDDYRWNACVDKVIREMDVISDRLGRIRSERERTLKAKRQLNRIVRPSPRTE